MQSMPVEPPCRTLPLQQGGNPLGDRTHVVRVNQLPESPAIKGIHGAIAITCKHWSAAGHCLKKYDAETLSRTRHRKHIGQSVVVDQFLIRHKAGEGYCVRQTEMACHLLEASAVVATPDQKKSYRAASGLDCWQCLHDPVIAFVSFSRVEPSNSKYHLLTRVLIVALGQILR